MGGEEGSGQGKGGDPTVREDGGPAGPQAGPIRAAPGGSEGDKDKGPAAGGSVAAPGSGQSSGAAGQGLGGAAAAWLSRAAGLGGLPAPQFGALRANQGGENPKMNVERAPSIKRSAESDIQKEKSPRKSKSPPAIENARAAFALTAESAAKDSEILQLKLKHQKEMQELANKQAETQARLQQTVDVASSAVQQARGEAKVAEGAAESMAQESQKAQAAASQAASAAAAWQNEAHKSELIRAKVEAQAKQVAEIAKTQAEQ